MFGSPEGDIEDVTPAAIAHLAWPGGGAREQPVVWCELHGQTLRRSSMR